MILGGSSVAPWWLLGGSLVHCRCGSRPFFIALARVKLGSAARERTRARNIRITSAILWFPCPIFRYMHYFSCFFDKSDPRLGRRHIFEDRPTPFCIQKYHFLDPQPELKITMFVSLLLPSTPLSFGSGFFALGANLEPTWGQLGSHLGQLGPTWCQLGANFGDLGANFG